jgi:hypothetical protein
MGGKAMIKLVSWPEPLVQQDFIFPVNQDVAGYSVSRRWSAWRRGLPSRRTGVLKRRKTKSLRFGIIAARLFQSIAHAAK